MNNLGLLQMLGAGQVVPTRSFVHRLDPRTRILGFLGLLLVIVASGDPAAAGVALAAVLALIALARIPLPYALRGLWLLLPWLAAVVVIQLAFGVGGGAGCRPVVEWGPVTLSDCTLAFALLTLLRFAGLVLLMGLLTWTLPVPDMARGLEALARPAARLGLPAHELALVGVIAIRFVPTLALEMERLQKAQRARGSELGSGRAGFVQRVRRTLPLIVPLFVLALRRAERLAEAMEARAYHGGRGRTSYARSHLSRSDWLALGVVAAFVATVWWLL